VALDLDGVFSSVRAGGLHHEEEDLIEDFVASKGVSQVGGMGGVGVHRAREYGISDGESFGAGDTDDGDPPFTGRCGNGGDGLGHPKIREMSE
jgi:hypothetical protein